MATPPTLAPVAAVLSASVEYTSVRLLPAMPPPKVLGALLAVLLLTVELVRTMVPPAMPAALALEVPVQAGQLVWLPETVELINIKVPGTRSPPPVAAVPAPVDVFVTALPLTVELTRVTSPFD